MVRLNNSVQKIFNELDRIGARNLESKPGDGRLD